MGTKFVSFPRWTAQEDARLRKWFKRGGFTSCCMHFRRRSTGAVYARLRKLRIIVAKPLQ